MPLTLDLTGHTALVTGGGRGVGRGVVDRLLAAGATVISCGRTDPDPPLPPGAEHRTADVRDAEAVRDLVEGIAADHGHLDLVVNNAGGAPHALTAEASPRFTAAIVGLNLLAPLTVAQAANRVMRRQDRGGHIINISSET